MGWKIAALVACGGVLFWTLSSPTSDGEIGEDDGGDPGGPPRALPPGPPGPPGPSVVAGPPAQGTDAAAAVADPATGSEAG